MTDLQPSCNSPCTTQTAAPETYDLHTDVLWGARNISKFLYGSEEYYRKVYSLVATSRIPIIHLGGRLCARKTALMAYITALEKK